MVWPGVGASLEGLECIQAIAGDLRIEETMLLESLDGLKNLKRVGGLRIRNNRKLCQDEAEKFAERIEITGPGAADISDNKECL